MLLLQWGIQIDDAIGAEGGEDASVPARGANGLMMLERIRCRIGSAKDFDVESGEEPAG